jgi:molybdate transport system substrate-binding protein
LESVAPGSVDAGFVYATDAASRSGVRVLARIADALHDPILYPIAPLKASEQGRRAHAFVDFVLSPPGQEILGRYGFLRPGPPGKK